MIAVIFKCVNAVLNKKKKKNFKQRQRNIKKQIETKWKRGKV